MFLVNLFLLLCVASVSNDSRFSVKVGVRAKKHFLDGHAGNTCSTGYVFTGFKCHEEPRKRKFFTVLSSVYQAWVFISCQLTQIIREYYRYNPGAHFSKVLKTFQVQKAVLCLSCLYARLKFQEFRDILIQ